MENGYNARLHELDSFYESKIGILSSDAVLSAGILSEFTGNGFELCRVFTSYAGFINEIHEKKYDLLIIDLDSREDEISGADVILKIRNSDADVAVITISDDSGDVRLKLECSIHRHFTRGFNIADLIKGSKKALGDKASYEIGMQFFDALFGMQMCTHRDLHQRTFDHVIRTTKVYGKFLLYLIGKKYIELTSWTLKNCLMASLVHDIGKLLVMHGILYKDGRLTAFEYEQVKRHPWNSITALLGGHDIDFFAQDGKPLETVTGYNDKNLSVQVQKWIFKIFDGDMSSLSDEEKYFEELSQKPFIHSLNIDFLYIVFRHHDSIHQPYLSKEELMRFGQILGKEIHVDLSPDSILDTVTNALSLCDMYDALLDTKRDYRKVSYSCFYALILLYDEMKNGKFFKELTEEFIRFIITHELESGDNPFASLDAGESIEAIRTVSDVFSIDKNQESDFSDYFDRHKEEFLRCFTLKLPLDELLAKWNIYHAEQNRSRTAHFIRELKLVNLLDREPDLFTPEEKKVFDMLCLFYYSYSSSYKQKKLIDYLGYTVVKHRISGEAKARIISFLNSPDDLHKKDFEKMLFDSGYDRDNIFDAFRLYDEDTLINELNDFLRVQGL